jgi:inosose dehydratase
MGLGYTTMMYDSESIETGLGDIGACRYDGVEIGFEKLLDAGPENVDTWLREYDLELYCVMSAWLENEAAVDRVANHANIIGDLGGEYLGLLPPQRGSIDDETLEGWIDRLADAAAAAGLTPVIHHHGGTQIERLKEIEDWLNRSPHNVGLLWDTAHYYPYGEHYPAGTVTDGIERFADQIEYIHLKDVDPGAEFTEHRDALSTGDFHLDDVITYFRTFTDLGDGVLDFEAVSDALEGANYDGHLTIEIENRTHEPLVHAKRNYDYWRDVGGDP